MTKTSGEQILDLAHKSGLWRPKVVPCRTGNVQSWLLSFGEMPKRHVVEIFAMDDAEKKIAKFAPATA